MAQNEGENHSAEHEDIRDDAKASDGKSSSKDGAKKKQTNPLRRNLIIAGILLIAIGWLGYWFFTRNDIETDDAYTEGRAIAVAPHVSGYVTKLLVNDNQFVRKGQLLIKIDDRDYRATREKAGATIEQAQANLSGAFEKLSVAKMAFPGRFSAAQGALAAARAQLFKAERDYQRQRSVARAATTQQNIDYAKAALDQARAQMMQAQGDLEVARPVDPNIKSERDTMEQQRATLKIAQAQLTLASLNLDWTEVRAPHDGWIAQRNVEQGNFVQSGQKLFAIVEPEVWVVANYKETQITKMRPGQKVKISVDAYPSLQLEGHVDSIQSGAGAAFSTFPPENATGNFVKIVQRVPVKILIDQGLDPKIPLPLGVSVEPTVYVQ